MLAFQRGLERGRIHDGLSRKVQQHATGLERLQRFGIDHALGGGNLWYVQGDVVRAREEAGQVLHTLNIRGQTPGRIHRQSRVIAQHIHTQVQGRASDHGTNRAETNHPEGFTDQFATFKFLLFCFNELVEFRFVTDIGQGTHVLNTAEDVSRRQQHRGQNQLFNRVSVRSGRIKNDDTFLATGLYRNVVHASAGSSHGSQSWGQFVNGKLVAAQQHAIRVLYIGTNGVVAGSKALQSNRCDRVIGLDYVRVIFVHGPSNL